MAPNIRRPALLASSTFRRWIGLIMDSRRLVCAAVCQTTPCGSFSINSENVEVRGGGAGSFHHTHAAFDRRDSLSYAPARRGGCHSGSGPAATRDEGTVRFL